MQDASMLTFVLSSAVSVALVTSLKELILWVLNRKAKVTDDKADNFENVIITKLNDQQDQIDGLSRDQQKISEVIDGMNTRINLILDDYKIILKDKIKYLTLKYVELGEITFEEKQAIMHMWNVYHFDLKGNGDLDDYIALLEEVRVVGYPVPYYSAPNHVRKED